MGTYGVKHKRVTSFAMRTIIFWRENLNYLIVCFTYNLYFVSLSVPCFFNTFAFYCQYVYLALSVENICNETSRQVRMDRMFIRNHVLAKQNRHSSRQSHCVVTAMLHVRLVRQPQAEIFELSLARLISLLFLPIRNCFMCWLSSTSNEYFLIVCSINCWKSQYGKMQTWICCFYYLNIQLKCDKFAQIQNISSLLW